MEEILAQIPLEGVLFDLFGRTFADRVIVNKDCTKAFFTLVRSVANFDRTTKVLTVKRNDTESHAQVSPDDMAPSVFGDGA